jgi:hypothetical protein
VLFVKSMMLLFLKFKYYRDGKLLLVKSRMLLDCIFNDCRDVKELFVRLLK